MAQISLALPLSSFKERDRAKEREREGRLGLDYGWVRATELGSVLWRNHMPMGQIGAVCFCLPSNSSSTARGVCRAEGGSQKREDQDRSRLKVGGAVGCFFFY